jgi:hypothetical protein
LNLAQREGSVVKIPRATTRAAVASPKGRDFAHWGVGISARLAPSGTSRAGSTKANGSPLRGNPSRFAMFRTEPLASIGRNLM